MRAHEYQAKPEQFSLEIDDPRAVLKDMMAQETELRDPRTHDRITTRFRDLLFSDDGKDLLEEVIFNWAHNNYISLSYELRRAPETENLRRRTQENRRENIERVKITIAKNVREKAKIILLDMIMPNGEPLRSNTGSDCRHIGGWLNVVADRLEPDQLVGDVLSEAALMKIYQVRFEPRD